MLPASSSNFSSSPAWLREDIDDLNSAHSTIPLNDDNQPGKTPTRQGQDNSQKETSNSAFVRNKVILHWIMKIISLSLCVLMATTATIGLLTIHTVDESGKIYVGIYMFFFATLLFFFELLGIRSVEWLDHFYRRNFGFLFNVIGKAFFIIFIAFLSFGLGAPETLSFLTGISLALFGIGIIALYLKYPEVFDP